MTHITETKAVVKRAASDQIASESRERMMQLLGVPEVEQFFFESYLKALKRGDPRVTQLHAQIMGLQKPPEQNVTFVLAQRYGLGSEAELERIVTRHKEVGNLSAEQKFQRCLQYCKEFLFRFPERKTEALSELGVVAFRKESHAEIEEEGVPDDASGSHGA